MIGVPGYENSLGGHGQMLGATRVYPDPPHTDEGVAGLEKDLHRDGGLLQANHPTDPLWSYDYVHVPVDTVEVWNEPWIYQPPFPASSDHDAQLAFGTALLDRGAHVGFTGGSDSHWKSTVAAQGPGQPTTWVYASAPTVEGILAGLRAGRTAVSAEPPNLGGARLFLEGKVDGAWTAMQGDTVAPGTPLRVRVQDAPGATVRLFGDHGAKVLDTTVTSADFTAETTAPANLSYVYAQLFGDDRDAERMQLCAAVPMIELDGQTTSCRNRVAMLALTSAIYFRPARLPRLP